jgi:hypothetical protein
MKTGHRVKRRTIEEDEDGDDDEGKQRSEEK